MADRDRWNPHYYGRRSWREVAATLGMENVTKVKAWETDRAVTERMCDIAGAPKRERYVAMSPQATAAWLETDEGR